jgi:RNA polymerase-interacting CarD/CdnL/TRCF family regulator
MSHFNEMFRLGDAVFHPKYGLGTVHSLSRRDRTHPVQELMSVESDRTEHYYNIHLNVRYEQCGTLKTEGRPHGLYC